MSEIDRRQFQVTLLERGTYLAEVMESGEDRNVLLIGLQFFNVINLVNPDFERDVTPGDLHFVDSRLIRASSIIFKLSSEIQRTQYLQEQILEHLREVLHLDEEDRELMSLLRSICETVEEEIVSLQAGYIVSITEIAVQLHRPNFVPAAKSFIEGLEKVRLFDIGPEAIQGEASSCAICMEGFADVADNDEVAAESSDERLIARLPCSHLYHSDCVVRWLEISHLCPTCRFTIPTEEVEGETSEPSNTMPVLVEASQPSQASNTMPTEEVEGEPSAPSNTMPLLVEVGQQSQASNTMPILEADEPSELSNTMPIVEASEQSQASNTMPILEADEPPELPNRMLVVEVADPSRSSNPMQTMEVANPSELPNATPIMEVIESSQPSNTVPFVDVDEQPSELSSPIPSVEVGKSASQTSNTMPIVVADQPSKSSNLTPIVEHGQPSEHSNPMQIVGGGKPSEPSRMRRPTVLGIIMSVAGVMATLMYFLADY